MINSTSLKLKVFSIQNTLLIGKLRQDTDWEKIFQTTYITENCI